MPGVVGGGAVHALCGGRHAAVDVPGADDERDLDAARRTRVDLAGDRRHPLRVDAVGLGRP